MSLEGVEEGYDMYLCVADPLVVAHHILVLHLWLQLWLSCSCASTRVGGDCSPPLILRGSLYFPSPGFLPGHWRWLGLCTGAAWKWAWGSQHPSGWPYPGSDGRPWVNALALSRGVFWCSSAPCRAQAIALACDFENALFPKLSFSLPCPLHFLAWVSSTCVFLWGRRSDFPLRRIRNTCTARSSNFHKYSFICSSPRSYGVSRVSLTLQTTAQIRKVCLLPTLFSEFLGHIGDLRANSGFVMPNRARIPSYHCCLLQKDVALSGDTREASLQLWLFEFLWEFIWAKPTMHTGSKISCSPREALLRNYSHI